VARVRRGPHRKGEEPKPINTLSKRFSRQHILLVLDGALNHTTDDLLIAALNPQENIWDEIREKIFKNYALNHFKSNAIQRWSNPSRPFHISSVQCDV
jgi:hypothetical protein